MHVQRPTHRACVRAVVLMTDYAESPSVGERDPRLDRQIEGLGGAEIEIGGGVARKIGLKTLR
jgi:hypothetical protein